MVHPGNRRYNESRKTHLRKKPRMPAPSRLREVTAEEQDHIDLLRRSKTAPSITNRITPTIASGLVFSGTPRRRARRQIITARGKARTPAESALPSTMLVRGMGLARNLWITPGRASR